MTSLKARFGNAVEDAPEPYELELLVLDDERVFSYDNTYLSPLVSRRLLVDLISTLRRDSLGDDLIPEAFLERLDDLTREQVDAGRSMGKGTAVRLEALNEIRDEFGLSTLPETED